jgi:hypothetical protein
MACNCNKTTITSLPLNMIDKAVHGVAGIVKSRLGIGLARSNVIADRRDICNNCDKVTKGLINTCSLCSCVISEKTRLAEEKCPLGKW